MCLIGVRGQLAGQLPSRTKFGYCISEHWVCLTWSCYL